MSRESGISGIRYSLLVSTSFGLFQHGLDRIHLCLEVFSLPIIITPIKITYLSLPVL